jgi:hypothetical protein
MGLRLRTTGHWLLVLVASVALAGCSGGSDPAPPAPPPGPVDPLRDIARREGDVRVVVVLAVEPERPGIWDRREVALAQERLLRAVRPGVHVVRRLEEFPQAVLRVTAPALQRLRQSDLVLDISLDRAGDTNQ